MSTFCTPCHTNTFVASHDESISNPLGNGYNNVARFSISSYEMQDAFTEMPALRQTFGSAGTPFSKASGIVFPTENYLKNNSAPKRSIGKRILASFVNLFLDPIFIESQPTEVG